MASSRSLSRDNSSAITCGGRCALSICMQSPSIRPPYAKSRQTDYPQMKVGLRLVFCSLASSIAIRVFRSSYSSKSRGDIPPPVDLCRAAACFSRKSTTSCRARSRRRSFTISISSRFTPDVLYADCEYHVKDLPQEEETGAHPATAQQSRKAAGEEELRSAVNGGSAINRTATRLAPG